MGHKPKVYGWLCDATDQVPFSCLDRWASVITDTMIRTLTPLEAQVLISQGDLDVVDVRDPREWSRGHIPRARPLPLAEITADPRTALPRDGVVFVCARGVRSLTAARAAEAVGLERLYSVEGGTQAWSSAGLALVSEGGGI